jgi:hypothetical protein
VKCVSRASVRVSRSRSPPPAPGDHCGQRQAGSPAEPARESQVTVNRSPTPSTSNIVPPPGLAASPPAWCRVS